jgi:hypothetical protein
LNDRDEKDRYPQEREAALERTGLFMLSAKGWSGDASFFAMLRYDFHGIEFPAAGLIFRAFGRKRLGRKAGCLFSPFRVQ